MTEQSSKGDTPEKQSAGQAEPDRYISFKGIDCDGNADRLVARLRHQLETNDQVDPKWKTYFQQRFEQQQKMGHDNLHLVGAQTNPLYMFFEECGDQDARDLLWQLEQECC
jgi:hypothetical protein